MAIRGALEATPAWLAMTMCGHEVIIVSFLSVLLFFPTAVVRRMPAIPAVSYGSFDELVYEQLFFSSRGVVEVSNKKQ